MLKRAILPCLIFGLSVTSTASADWFFQPKAGFEIRNVEFESGNLQGSASIPSMILGFSVVNSGGYYFDLDFSSGDSEVSNFYPEDDYIERFDVTLSAGYSLGDGLTVFGGINSTDTQIENQKGQVNQPVDYQIIAEGPFLGLAKTFSMDKSSSITASIAAGMMTGKYESTDIELDSLDGEGDSIGYSASVSYTKRIEKTTISAGIKNQSYTYSDMTTYQDNSALPDASDEMTSFFVKAAYTF